MWSLITLGASRLVDPSTCEEQLTGRRKELALLAYLARRAPRTVSRATLADLLWGDREEHRARASVRQALSQIRRVLGDGLHTNGEEIGLARGAVDLDSARFEADVGESRWADAVARWQGDFLPGAEDLGGEACREWLDGERARLRCLAERAFHALVEAHAVRGAHDEAVDVARRWCDTLPFDDSAVLWLVRSLARANRLTEAHAALREACARLNADGDGRRSEDLVAAAALPPPVDRGDIGTPLPPPLVTPKGGELVQDKPATNAPQRRRRYLAGAGLVVVAGALMAVGARGRASVATLEAPQTVLVSDVRLTGVDSAIGDAVGGALRVGLRKSRVLAVYPDAAVQSAMRRVRPEARNRLDLSLAREIAAGAGIKAVVQGEVVGSGGRYLLSARLVATVSGEDLAQVSAEARRRDEILPAVDRLVAELRTAAGEPLRAVEAARPVERVTTASLDAYAKYVLATRAFDLEGAPSKGLALLEEAIALDTTFAMAYRRLAIELNDRGGHDQRVRTVIQRAYEHRLRLADPERYAIEAAYFSMGPVPDEDRAVSAYESALVVEPRFGVALNNLAEILLRRHRFERAESLFTVLLAQNTASVQAHRNLVQVQVGRGNFGAAERTLAHLDSVSPGSEYGAVLRGEFLYAAGRRDSAATLLRRVFETTTDVTRQEYVSGVLRNLALARGQLNEALAWSRVWSDARLRRGVASATIAGALDAAWIDLWYRHDTVKALQSTRAALSHTHLGSIPALDRPYGMLVRLRAWGGQPALARVALAGFDSAVGEPARPRNRRRRALYRGEIALAARRWSDAIDAFRAADSSSCRTCVLPFLGFAYDRAGVADSAVALYGRFVDTRELGRDEEDAMFLPLAIQRLGELLEARGDHAGAEVRQKAYADLMKSADRDARSSVVLSPAIAASSGRRR